MSMGPGGFPPAGQGPEGEEPDFAKLFSEFMDQGGLDPQAMAALGLPTDPAMMQQIMAQVQAMMTSTGDGPVNWDLAKDTARQVTAMSGDASVGGTAARAAVDALRLADMWLNDVTSVSATATQEVAWSRAEWVEATWSTWQRLTLPVAESVSSAITDAMMKQTPPEMAAMVGQASSMLSKIGGSMFGAQAGQAVGTLASEVLSGSDIGLPLAQPGTRALLPSNIAAFSEGLDVPEQEIRLYLALREAAHARLFGHAAWLGPRLLGNIEAYARGIAIDTTQIEQAVSELDPSDPEALQRALQGGLFEPARSPEQEAALTRLETTLALVEGWVDTVVERAATGHLPGAARLQEAVRRRRATGGPAERTFASLVGLELRPRRLRDASALWRALEAKHGETARDQVWNQPDLIPGTEDLDDPLGFAENWGIAAHVPDDMDAALAALLDSAADKGSDGRPGDDAGEGPGHGETPQNDA